DPGRDRQLLARQRHAAALVSRFLPAGGRSCLPGACRCGGQATVPGIRRYVRYPASGTADPLAWKGDDAGLRPPEPGLPHGRRQPPNPGLAWAARGGSDSSPSKVAAVSGVPPRPTTSELARASSPPSISSRRGSPCGGVVPASSATAWLEPPSDLCR